jgi:uncharacterized protein YprB with RNaseH-like and TPR domain
MLTSTFCHLPGVGPKTEQALWAAGFLSWESALRDGVGSSSRQFKKTWLALLQESLDRRQHQELGYFTARMPTSQHWRLFRDFRYSCAFVDIETTGLSHYADQITTIVLYDGQTIRHYIHGENLDAFLEDIQGYRLLVSYNGKSFDVPFIEHYFGIELPQAHIDLRHVLRALGVAGGLKNCEQTLGIRRQESADIDGFLAVLLWREYRRTQDRRFLETLLAYNVEDAVNLEVLMVMAFNKNLTGTPFTELGLPLPTLAASPFRVDREAVAQVARRIW